MRVLLVDDSPDAQGFLRHELEQAGISVVTATSGEQALALLPAKAVDAVLLDVLMPGGIDGFETCVRLRRHDRSLPVIFMTGLGETEHIVKGFQAGGNDYVTKPVTAAEVVARLGAHTRTARLVRATRDAIDAADQAMLAIDSQGLLLWANARTRDLLAAHGLQAAIAELHPLPPPLAPLLALRTDEDPVQLSLGGAPLRASRLDEPNPSVCVIRVEPAGGAAPARPIHTMTARESEVLLWVTRGKTNRDIAEIIGISPRTVNKHLEHIFEKLGVETRTAAAAVASKLDLGNDGGRR